MQYLLWLGTGLKFGGPFLSCDPKKRILWDVFTNQKFVFICPDECINFIHVDFNHKIGPRHIQFDVLIPRGHPGVSVQVAESLSYLYMIMGS